VKNLKPRSSRLSPEDALAVATQTAPTLPPTRLGVDDRATTLNLRVRASTIDALLSAARARGLTMKQVVCQALSAAGVAVAPADLEDRTPRRREVGRL
jgi:hypothetical protein